MTEETYCEYRPIFSIALRVANQMYCDRQRMNDYGFANVFTEIQERADEAGFVLSPQSRCAILEFVLDPEVYTRPVPIPPEIFRSLDHDLSKMCIDKYFKTRARMYDQALLKLIEFDESMDVSDQVSQDNVKRWDDLWKIWRENKNDG